MARRRRAKKTPIMPDAKFGDLVISKFINCIMRDGRKAAAERIVYHAFDVVKEKTGSPPEELFHKALENVRPLAEVRSRRVGGATYQVPVEVRPERARALAINWIIAAARGRNQNTMTERLSSELLDAIENRGAAIKKREDTHRMAEANRAFAHYRW